MLCFPSSTCNPSLPSSHISPACEHPRTNLLTLCAAAARRTWNGTSGIPCMADKVGHPPDACNTNLENSTGTLRQEFWSSIINFFVLGRHRKEIKQGWITWHVWSPSLLLASHSRQDKLNNAPSNPRCKIDEVEAYIFPSRPIHYNINVSNLNVRLLREFTKNVKRHASSSYIKALYNAEDRHFETTKLEKCLLDSRIPI